MNHLKRVYKFKIKYNLEKLKEEVFLIDKDPGKFINDGSRDEEDFIWFFNKKIPEDWEISKFIKDFNFDMSGISKLRPKYCFSFHFDYSPRIHLAIQTDNKNFFSFIDGKSYRIPADGHPYLINTTEEHTFCNASLNTIRYHVAGHPHFMWAWDSLRNMEIMETYE